MTIVAFLCFLLVLFAVGLPLAFLLPRDSDGHRVVLAPILGICGIVLFTCFLASFGLTGRTIARVALIAVTGIAGTTICLCRFPKLLARARAEALSRGEFVAALPAWCAGLLALILVAWPLFAAGCTEYWGFANPDQAFYMTIVDHLEDHAFGQPPMDRFHEPAANGSIPGGKPSAILGLCYLFPMVSALTGIQSYFLFGVLCAVMVFLLPVSTYAMCRTGLGWSPREAVISALLVASSAVGAQTFYHHSLGALAVAVVGPMAVTLGIHYGRKPGVQTAVLIAVLLTGMLFCYFPGFAVTAILAGGTMLVPFLRRKVSARSLLVLGLLTAFLPFFVYSAQTVSLVTTLVKESRSTRLASSADELLLTIDSVLTEEIVPFVWGLKTPGVPTARFLGSTFQAWAVLLFFGTVLSAITLITLCRRGLRTEFKAALGTGCAVTLLYFARGNGYGVYKLITWLAPLLTVALSASWFTLYGRRMHVIRPIAVSVLVCYAAFNISEVCRLASFSRRGEFGTTHNAPGATLRDMRELRSATGGGSRPPVFGAIADAVLQRWATPFLPSTEMRYLPALTLNVLDSDTASAAEYRKWILSKLQPGYLLYTGAALGDVVRMAESRPIWSNRLFAITPLHQVRDQLLLGAGWYRREVFPGAGKEPFRWIRKRGELLLLNPSSGPRRLLFRMLTGPGNPSPLRHITLFVNGKPFDKVTVYGQSRFITQPFLCPGRACQIEIAVEEDAKFLPRRFGLWNRWVPRDARCLNVGVFDAELEPLEPSAIPLKSNADFRAGDEFSRSLYNGVYPDRWIASRASVELLMPRNARSLRVRGMVPGSTKLVFPIPLSIFAAGQPLAEALVDRPGDFDVSVAVSKPSGGGDRNVSVTIQPGPGCFVGAGETRCLAVRLDEIAFDAAKATQKAAAK